MFYHWILWIDEMNEERDYETINENTYGLYLYSYELIEEKSNFDTHWCADY